MGKFYGDGPNSLRWKGSVTLRVFPTPEARLDVVQHRHQIGDSVDHIMGAALVHGRIDAVAMHLFFVVGRCPWATYLILLWLRVESKKQV